MTLRFAFLELLLGGWRGAFGLALLACVLPRNAAAQSLPLELTWQAPPECPQRDAVVARARALLGAKTLKTAVVQAQGTIDRQGEGFELTLAIDEGGKGGERRVWARQCDELSGAAAIALVLLLTSDSDRGGLNGTELRPPEGTAGQAPAPAPREQPKPPSEDKGPDGSSAEPERRWRFLAMAPQLAVGIGPLPKPSLGLGAGLGFQGRGWSLRLLGQWFSSQAVAAPVQPYGADVKRLSASLWGCWDLQRAGWSFSPCLLTSVAQLEATGFGPRLRPATQTEASVGIGIGGIGRLQATSWLSLMASVGMQAELSRPIIVLGSLGIVQQLAPVSAVVQLGPEWIF
jgi:hypothetical protein